MLTAGNWKRADTEERAFECDDCGHVEAMPKGQPHGCPKGPRPGEVTTYTTAGPEYDWFGTREIGTAGVNGKGKPVRKVAGPEGHLDGQRGRYMSGNHMAVDEAEWRKLVEYGLATEAESRPA